MQKRNYMCINTLLLSKAQRTRDDLPTRVVHTSYDAIVHYNIIESCIRTNLILYSTCNLGQNIPTWSAAADNKHRTRAKLA